MKKFKKNSIATAVVVLFTLGLAGMAMAVTPQPVDLGGADSFAILAGSAISAPVGGSAVSGNVGLSPTGGTAITDLSCSDTTGTIYETNSGYLGGHDSTTGCAVVNSTSLLNTAKSDLGIAYNNARDQATTTVISADLGGMILTPGVYGADSSLGLTGTVTLNGGGDPNAVFIFKAGSTLTTASASEVKLTNGAQSCNVFWQIGSSATLGSGSDFKGTILAMASISDTSGSTVLGRLLARDGAVTLRNTKVTKEACAPAYTLHVFKQVVNTGGGTAVPSDFSLHVKFSGTDVTGSPKPGNSSGDNYTLVPSATYVVSEDANASYTQSFSGDCDSSGSVTLAADGKTCTITNTYVPPVTHSSSIASAPATLHVIKHVVNSGGGTATASSFAVHVKTPTVPVASDVIGSPAAGVEAPGTSYRLSVGTYAVSEDANASYTQSFSGDCDSSGSVTLSTGADKTCTITNTYQTVTTPTVTTTTTITTTPKLPNTGLSPQSKTPWDIFITAGILMLVSVSVVLALKKRTA